MHDSVKTKDGQGPLAQPCIQMNNYLLLHVVLAHTL